METSQDAAHVNDRMHANTNIYSLFSSNILWFFSLPNDSPCDFIMKYYSHLKAKDISTSSCQIKLDNRL